MNDSDNEIIDKILDGDHDAYEALVDRYKNRMYAIALARTGDRIAVEDIVQQAFVEAYSKLGALRDRDRFYPWLSRITADLCYHWQQKRSSHVSLLDAYGRQLNTVEDETPEMLYMAGQMRRRIFSALDELDPVLREVAVLRYMEDLPYRDIAECLHLPESTVKGRLQLARGRLHVALLPLVSDALQTLRPPSDFTRKVMTVTTIAGTDERGYRDGPGDRARFDDPMDIVRDKSGNIYIVEARGNRVRRIDRFGQVSTIAGSGLRGFADGPGPAARFHQPVSIAIDAAGNLYVGDQFNHRIRKIAPDGYVTTLAGTGAPGMSDGPGATARFYHPSDLIVAPDGALIVLDSGNCRICRVDSAGYVRTIGGTGVGGFRDGPVGSARFGEPRGLVMDAHGAIYIADTFYHRIRKLDRFGRVTTIAGSGRPGLKDGPALSAELYEPFAIALGPDGSLYVTETPKNIERTRPHTIRRLRPVPSGYYVETIAGRGVRGFADGPSTRARFDHPGGILIGHAGEIIVADTGNGRIRKFLPQPG